MNAPVIEIGFLLFPRLTQLDLTGPMQVLSRVPAARIHVIWKRIEPVPSDATLTLLPNRTFNDCPSLDVLCVPGGAGVIDLLEDEDVLAFVRDQGGRARYVTSVCTGALLLGAAGLLNGYDAATHWAWMDQLARFGARPVKTRVCIDRNRITGGGVTAGIDFGLKVAELLSDRLVAETIQLGLEYNPDPPFNSGSPDTAAADVLARYWSLSSARIGQGREVIARAAARLRS